MAKIQIKSDKITFFEDYVINKVLAFVSIENRNGNANVRFH